MLDKTIPFQDIVMMITAEDCARIKEPALPDGYRFRFYQDGMERGWVAVEAAVNEFDDEQKAAAQFTKEFLPERELLKTRMVFIVDENGEPAATATAWYRDYQGRFQPMVHWVATHPAHQRRGLAKAVLQKVLTIFSAVYPGRDVYLHTQTWSHTAVRMYSNLGFHMMKTDTLGWYKNSYGAAMEVLATVLSEETMEKLRRESR